jgi:outer membrane protein
MKKIFFSYFLLLTSCFCLFGLSTIIAQNKVYSLKECLDQALQKNIQLNQTQLSSQMNKVNLDQSKMNLYPNLNFNDNQIFSWGYSSNPATNQFVKQNIAANSPSLTSSVTLFNGFFNINTIKQNQYVYDAGKYDVDKIKNDLYLSVVAAYLQVIYSYEAVDIAKAQMANTAESVDRTQKFVDAGKLAEGNLFQIQSQLASDNAAEVSAENQLQLSKVALMQMMEMPITDNFDVDRKGLTEPIIEPLLSSEDIYKTSETIMPEIKSAELKTSASELGIKLAQSIEIPKLTLGGSLKTAYSSAGSKYSTTYQYQDMGSYIQGSDPVEHVLELVPFSVKQSYPFMNQFKDNFGQAISLGLTVPIFNNYQGKYGIEKAKISLQITKLNENAAKIQLRKNVEQAYTDLNAAIKNYAAAKDGLKSEDRAYKDMEKKFNIGLVAATDYLVEKNNYEKSTLALVQAKYNYIFKSKILDFYLGKIITN